MAKLNIGLIGVGRLGRVYARDLSTRIASTRLTAIADPVVFKSTSRDPYPPSLSYADPRSSGGLIIDMGIHDFDLARWYMGEVASVQAIGGVLAYPDFATIGDIDNAVVSLVFANGR